MTTTIKFTAPVEITAAAKSKGPRRFSTVAYTGTALRVSGYSQPVIIDLSGLTTRRSVTANLDHDPAKRVGHVDDVRNDGSQLVLGGVVSAANAAADEFVTAHDRGYPWQASVEVSPEALEHVHDGEHIEVNGQRFEGPLYVTRKGVLSAVAFVPNGADDATHVSIAANLRRGIPVSKNCSFQDFVSEFMPGANLDDMTEKQVAGLHANYMGRNEPIAADFAAVAPMIHASSDPVEAEERRVRQIERATAGEWGDETENVHQLKASALGGELSVDDLLSQIRGIRMNIEERKMATALPPVSGRRNMEPEIIEAAFCLNAGIVNVEKHYHERVLDAADKYRRGLTLQTFLMQAACANGYQARPGEGITDGNLRSVLAHAFAPIKAAGFSTYSTPNVLSNVANKHLLQGFQEMGDEWREISEVKPVSDFKQNTFVRLLDNLPYEQVAPGGELQHGTIGDDTMTGRAYTYGTILGIDRTAIINDDQGAFMDIPRRLGRSAGQKLRRLFWTAFMAADNFFSVGNGNVTDGQLTDDGDDLAAALKVFRAMRSPAADGSRLLGGQPAVMLVSPNDEITARRLINSSGIVAGGGSSTTTVGNANPFANLAKLVVVDWLVDTSLGGTADTNEWYLFRSPSLLPSMLVLALNGRVEPTVETADADFSTLGILMRGYSDIGVARGEPLAGLKITGDPIGT